MRDTNPNYLRKKVGAVEVKSDLYLSSESGIRGIVDEVLFLEDGSAAPLDYKYAEYKDKIFKTSDLGTSKRHYFYDKLL